MNSPTDRKHKGPGSAGKAAGGPAKAPGGAAKKPPAAPLPPKVAPTAAPKSTSPKSTVPSTPPAPRPRAPGAAERDTRLEERRVQIRARQQERRQEVQQAKRSKLGTRYSVIVGLLLLVGLVSFFEIEHQPLYAIISGVGILVALIAVVVVLNVAMPTRRARPQPRGAPTAGTAHADSASSQESLRGATARPPADQAGMLPEDVPLPSADPDSE
jgi:hypothetical protein